MICRFWLFAFMATVCTRTGFFSTLALDAQMSRLLAKTRQTFAERVHPQKVFSQSQNKMFNNKFILLREGERGIGWYTYIIFVIDCDISRGAEKFILNTLKKFSKIVFDKDRP